ncbi:preprotein translocase subunit SecG [Saccharicrinis sp. FJH2]|uniref:preprotein translocase subunit SecG n=1 Tax=unclassified Saccharicrinis TaxID=2646859 RepID=UPI0035D52B96
MYLLISILIFIAAVLLILIVLVQNSKGGGLASNFASSNQIMGVRKTTDFLEKATWTLSIAILVLCIAGAAAIPRSSGQAESAIQERVEQTIDPNQVPQFPTEAPALEEQDSDTE